MSALLILIISYLIHSNIAEYTIQSTDILGNDITCSQNDDCFVNCTDCSDKIINCKSSYSCSINCVDCESTSIFAYNIDNININCTSCKNTKIDVSLNNQDSQFQLYCHNLTAGNSGFTLIININVNCNNRLFRYTR
eukprot:474562_1